MSSNKITPETFKALLLGICDRETSQSPESWKAANPLWGHCAVVSLVAQNFFGGELLRASLENANIGLFGSHYWNQLPDGTEYDFTIEQFEYKCPDRRKLIPVIRERSYVVSFPETSKRYKLLAWRLAKALENKPIFGSPIYQKCFYAALDSSCQKMKFGCVITHNREVVYVGYNKIIEPLKSLCQPACIRLSIASRTESMLGACGHAEEGLWKVVHKGIPINECELYIAGLYANGLPWFKEAPEHTCLRCAVQMYNANLRRIYVPVVDRWAGITPEQAVETAKDYALKEKTVEVLS